MALQRAIDPDDLLEGQDLHDRCHILIYSPTDEYTAAFVDSAVKFFEEVREEVEREPTDRRI